MASKVYDRCNFDYFCYEEPKLLPTQANLRNRFFVDVAVVAIEEVVVKEGKFQRIAILCF